MDVGRLMIKCQEKPRMPLRERYVAGPHLLLLSSQGIRLSGSVFGISLEVISCYERFTVCSTLDFNTVSRSQAMSAALYLPAGELDKRCTSR